MQLCAHIGRRLAAHPVLFVLTRRDKPERPDADALLADLAGRGVEVAEVELGPLSQAEVAAVARSVADLTEAAVEQVVRAADGNPLLAVDSARALAAGRGVPPQDLRAAVRAAAGTLARAARDLVEVLAAAGPGAVRHRDRRAAAGRPATKPSKPSWTPAWCSAAAAGCGSAMPCSPRRYAPTCGIQGRRYEQLALAIETAAAVTRSRLPPRWPATCTERAGTTWPGRGGNAPPVTPGRWARCPKRPASGPRRCAAPPTTAGPLLELAEAFGWLGQDADFEHDWQAALSACPQKGSR